jgi:hypothetical protein
VTEEQIRDAARAIFRADNRVILTYVPRTSESAADAVDGETDGEEAA